MVETDALPNVSQVESSRRDLLRGGTLLVGFCLIGPALADTTNAPALTGPRDPRAIDSWLAIHRDNTATFFFGKVELGQGNTTGLLQIGGEELDLGMHQMRAAVVDTSMSPDQGATVSSSSIEKAGPQIRAAAAEARLELLKRASAKLNVPAAQLTVTQGVVSSQGDPSKTVTYGELLGDRLFEIPFTGKAPLKKPADYKLVGTRVPRIDIPAKASGRQKYVHHVRIPGMLHGRVVRPRGQGAYGGEPTPRAIDEQSIADITDARVVRIGNFLGVVAEREWDAVRAAEQLKVDWDQPANLSGSDKPLYDRMRAANTKDSDIVHVGDSAVALASVTHKVSATYYCPYQAHAPFAPNCAVAQVEATGALVMCSTQDVFATRKTLASLLNMPLEKVQVIFYEGAGTFGHSCYDDAAQAAAIMSKAVGQPVRVQYMRWNEHGWDNYGPAHVADITVGANQDGQIVGYEYHGWQHGWMIPETTDVLARGTPAGEREKGSSIIVNKMSAGGMYNIPNRRLVNHHVPLLEGYPKGAYLRSPLDLSFCFVSEQTIDDLAYRIGIDPLTFRRKNIVDPRWSGVLEAVVESAKWKPTHKATRQRAPVMRGIGIGLGTHHVSYGAAIAEIEVHADTGVIRVLKIHAALDAGLAINPGLVENQIVGMCVQATSRVLKEEVTFTEREVTSTDWQSYPILRFSECPEVLPIVVQHIDKPATGAGEECMGATAAAIVNAFFDATGARLRTYPMTNERVRQALA